ncbi:hypothetical protein DL96DRAFT_1679061 [Flagelloscypha sp. PMI_526]|nr:hypothetical protein DL96DRAFT_1679061 [Flagelloscypha sp. PMI_526]
MSNPQGAVADVTSKAVSRATFIKLLVFAFSLAFFPITSFFVSKNYFWNGDATYAAITAIVACECGPSNLHFQCYPRRQRRPAFNYFGQEVPIVFRFEYSILMFRSQGPEMEAGLGFKRQI